MSLYTPALMVTPVTPVLLGGSRNMVTLQNQLIYQAAFHIPICSYDNDFHRELTKLETSCYVHASLFISQVIAV